MAQGLFTHLDSAALILGSIWVIIGLLWLAVLTGGFRQPPPEMAMSEAD